MRFLTTLLFVLIAFAVNGQKYQSAPNTQAKYLRADSGLTIPEDTTRPIGNNADSCRRLARKNNLLYLYNCDSAKWVVVSTAETPEVITASNGLTKDVSDIRLGGVFGDDGEDRTILGHNNTYLRIQGTEIDNYATDQYISEARVRARGVTLTSLNRTSGSNTILSVSSATGVTSTSRTGGSISSTNGDNSVHINIDNTSSLLDLASSKSSTGDATQIVLANAGNSYISTTVPFQIFAPLWGIQAPIQSDLLKNNIDLDSVLYTDENGFFKQRKLTEYSVSGAQNLVYATPTSTSGLATLRPLVTADIPALDATKVTTGILPIPRGGTGLSSLGSPLQQVRVNAGATSLEYFTPLGADTSRIRYDKVKKAITANATLDSTATKWLIDCTSADITITVPDATISPYWISTGTNVGYGVKYYILRTDNTAHVLTIQASGTQKIDGQSTFSIYNNSYLNLFTDGANWYSN
jgi:hypothetical protein